VYGVLVDVDDYIRQKDGREFDKEDYFENPEKYESVFHEEVTCIHQSMHFNQF
jgi:hypothetical protein